MAFKSVQNYNDERYKNLFILRDDGNYADVIFLYQNYNQVMMGEVHYIKSADFSGYVQCCGNGCPACAKGIRVQSKLFIPLYNIKAGEVQFFDRTMKFEPQLSRDVFSRFPDPSEFVFRITRHGAAGDINTTYSIEPVGNNKLMSYQDICTKFNLTFPDAYNQICKDVSIGELSAMLSTSATSTASNVPVMSDYSMPAYQITPRGVSAAPTVAEPPVIPPFDAASPVNAGAGVVIEAEQPLADYVVPSGPAVIDGPVSVGTVNASDIEGDPDIDNVEF